MQHTKRGSARLLPGVLFGWLVVSVSTSVGSFPSAQLNELWDAGRSNVHDIERQFNELALHGDPIAFHWEGSNEPDMCRHYQGVNRYNGPDGTAYLILTRSGNHTELPHVGVELCGSDDFPGELTVVRMESAPRNGERIGSNLHTPGKTMKSTPPPLSDTVVFSAGFEGHQAPGDAIPWPVYHHPGAGQIIGDVLAIPLENGDTQNTSTIVFFDLSDPENPRTIRQLALPGHPSLGVLGMTQLFTGRVLIAVTTSADSGDLRFYLSSGPDLHDPGTVFNVVDLWNKSELIGSSGGVSETWGAWQTINLFVADDGGIYLACTENYDPTNPITNANGDRARLFRITSHDALADLSLGDIEIEYRATKSLNARGHGGPDMGNADAAGGFYVSPRGSLMFYMFNNENTDDGDWVNGGEYRSYTHPASCGGWVELYNEERGWDDGWGTDDPSRSVMFEFDNKVDDDWHDFSEFDGLGDNVDSVRWNLPLGRTAHLYEHDSYGGKVLVLSGAGFINKLDDAEWSDGSSGVGDKISSISFSQALPPAVVPFQSIVCPAGASVPYHNVMADLVEIFPIQTFHKNGIRNGLMLSACASPPPDEDVKLLVTPGTYTETGWAEAPHGRFVITGPIMIESYNFGGPAGSVFIK